MSEGVDEFHGPFLDARDIGQAVAENHPNRCLARLQQLGDVVAVVEDGLAIIGPAWIEQRGGGLAPVDAEMVMAERADRDDRMANGLADSEAAPEDRKSTRLNSSH